MYKVGLYRQVRQAYYIQDKSIREISRIHNIHRDTVRKMLRYSVPSRVIKEVNHESNPS